MKYSSTPQSCPDTVCRARYIFLSRECRRHGLHKSAIERTAGELSRSIHGMCYLERDAYEPTGIALGCPLPDKRATRRLWRLSKLIDKGLAALLNSKEKAVAFVPPDWYHVTLVNHSHFDCDTEITPITEELKEKAQNVIAEISRGPIVLDLNGLILTPHGRLIAMGFPCDNKIYDLRSVLAETFPKLRVNLPITAHVKLGHVLSPLNPDDLKLFLDWVRVCGEHVSLRVVFCDVYTPAGRIVL